MQALSTTGATVLAGLVLVGCGGSDTSLSPSATTAANATGVTASPTPSPTTAAGGLPSMYSQFYGVQVSLDGASVVLRATSVPDHPSPYFGVGNMQYEAPQPGMQVNPNRIASQSLTLRVPAQPQVTGASDTPLGAMGVAINGVVLFNQYAAGRSPLDSEIPSFDRYNGHPQQTGTYHYHIEPVYLTAQGSGRLVGVLLDGFPVYGTRDPDGSAPSGLDACNGHVHATPEFASGVYHYHVVSTPPYIAGCFRGQPGSAG